MASVIVENIRIITIVILSIKLLINCCAVTLYRIGDQGHFMGATHNMNHDVEIFACAVLVGYLIFNLAQLVSKIIARFYMKSNTTKPAVLEVVMTAAGFLFWLIAGAMIIQFWTSYQPGNKFIKSTPKGPGLTMGVLAVLNGGLYLLETFLYWFAFKNGTKKTYGGSGEIYRSPTLNYEETRGLK